ncbi:excalibur calcium-binding domain-containing protein [Citricoccus alkalitolerans]|uniref:Excalibur calcium-binding domain-containing protein n=1 Tax=Citricoccus alkalitolerans TaxID=246603 RepID=A0ABV8XVA7_9MICC
MAEEKGAADRAAQAEADRQAAAEAERKATREREAAPAPVPTKAPEPTRAPASAFYANCDAARAAGAAPVYRGDPGYSKKLDRDGDGVGCE